VLGSWNGCRGGSLSIKFCGDICDFVDYDHKVGLVV